MAVKHSNRKLGFEVQTLHVVEKDSNVSALTSLHCHGVAFTSNQMRHFLK